MAKSMKTTRKVHGVGQVIPDPVFTERYSVCGPVHPPPHIMATNHVMPARGHRPTRVVLQNWCLHRGFAQFCTFFEAAELDSDRKENVEVR